MIDIEHHGQITTVKLNRPPANAIDAALLSKLNENIKEQSNNDSKAIILTGQASIFSAGVDLIQLLKGGDDYVVKFLAALQEMLDTLFFCPKPVVAAVNGHAIAGGCVIVCCADYRIMAQGKGRIGVPELRVGVPFPVIIMELMRAKVNQASFEEIMLAGQTYLPDTAKDIGLIDEVVDADELMEKAMNYAQSLAAIRPEIYSFTKLQIRQAVRERIESNHDQFTDKINEIWASEQTRQAIQHYVDKMLKK